MQQSKVFLKKYWGHDTFRGSQEALIETLIQGKDVIGLMPTGGGKTLCYQIPALAREGVALVISPLIALMEDQLNTLKAKGIKAMGLFGRLSDEDLIRQLDNADFGGYQILYLSPERLRRELVLERISRIEVALIAIDEAHCISQWGFDFRPAYLDCVKLRDLHPDVPVAALTATATPEVLEDIRNLLRLEQATLFKDSIERKNIVYTLLETQDKRYRLKALFGAQEGSGIVYVQTRRATAQLAAYLNEHGISATFYHGGLDGDQKKERLHKWQGGAIRIMVATNAFGMGIDKADVRLVIHYHLPETIEHYFQEAGRAGRDGAPAEAVLLLGPSDWEDSKRHYLGSIPTIEDLLLTYSKLNAYFRIPYGELPVQSFPFEFDAFCQTYSLPRAKTYNSLELLDRQGVLRLSQRSMRMVTLHFICSKGTLWDYLETYPKFRNPVQTLLRTYGGLFDFETPINTYRLSRKLSVKESELIGMLQQLEKDDLIALQLRQGDLELTFLQPREDEHTIHAFARTVETRRRLKIDKVGQFGAFLKNTKRCRQIQLLEYFGEKDASPCGGCDVCRTGKISHKNAKVLEAKVIQALNHGPKSSRELVGAGLGPEEHLLICLQHLLEDGQLSLEGQNKYRILEK
jgi:ATP-dependent DNA helicase RecQ